MSLLNTIQETVRRPFQSDEEEKKTLTIVGTVAFDAIETPFGKTDKIVGGAATYISLSASYFSKKINLVSVVGDDFPADFIADLQRRNVNTEGLQIRKGEKSFFWSGKYHTDMNTRDTLDTQLNVLADFNPVVPDAYQKTDYLMLGNLAPSIQLRVLQQLKKRPRIVAMDTMNFWMTHARNDLDIVLKMIDVLVINDAEARELTGEFSLVKSAKKILQAWSQIPDHQKRRAWRITFS